MNCCETVEGIALPCSHDRTVSMLAWRIVAACACVIFRRLRQIFSLSAKLVSLFIETILADFTSSARTFLNYFPLKFFHAFDNKRITTATTRAITKALNNGTSNDRLVIGAFIEKLSFDDKLSEFYGPSVSIPVPIVRFLPIL